jgi:hypothetical protein
MKMKEVPRDRILKYQNLENVIDIVYYFIEDFTEEAMGAFIVKAELFKVFQEFCEKYYINKAFYLNIMSFGRIMKKLEYRDSIRIVNGKRCHVWLGFKWLTSSSSSTSS